ncbi:MAG: DNA primase [Pseudomonadota bacterium]|nr:DNA primase [Pseudomonadota bacterium]
MAGMIPKDFIQELIDRIDIVDVIRSRIEVKKMGQHFKACCPFHKEKTPSFVIYDDHYHCYGCGAHGDAIHFLMEHDHLEFTEAVEQLAQTQHIEIPYEQGSQTPAERAAYQEKKQRQQTLQQALVLCAETYYQQLASQRYPEPIQYLKSRGLTGLIAKRFQLGYAPDAYDTIQTLAKNNGIPEALFDQAGMIAHNEQKQRQYDRFRHRIMFPIRDHRGQVVGFGGRVLDDSKPKYLNSPETPLFKKNETLYGLWEARQSDQRFDWALVTEGYMDVIALAQYGITQGVATLGTATSETHIRRLFRYVDEVIFCFDGDKAGQAAAKKALIPCCKAWQDGKQIRFYFLPEGHDPDSWVRELSKDQFLETMREAMQSLDEFLLDTLADGLNLNSHVDKTQFIKRAQLYFAELPEGIFHDALLSAMAQRCELELSLVLKHLRALPAQNPQASSSMHHNNSDNIDHYAENSYSERGDNRRFSTHGSLPETESQVATRLVQILIQHPELAHHHELPEDSLAAQPSFDLFRELFMLARQIDNVNTRRLLVKLQQAPLKPHILKILGQSAPTQKLSDDALEQEFIDILRSLGEVDSLRSALKAAQLAGDIQQVTALKKALEEARKKG